MEKSDLYAAFDEQNFSTIVQNLSKLDSAESAEALKQLSQVCPLSVLLSNEIFNLGQRETYANCLRNEFRMNRIQFRDQNFAEGVRALLLDKGRQPQWKPATLVSKYLIGSLMAKRHEKWSHIRPGFDCSKIGFHDGSIRR